MKPQTRVGIEIIGTLSIVALLAIAPLALHTMIPWRRSSHRGCCSR